MQLFVIVLLGAVILGLGLRLRADSRRRSKPATPPLRTRARAAVAASRREDANPPASDPGVDIWRFRKAPAEARCSESESWDESDMSDVMARAEGVAGHLKARQSVMAGVSNADFDPKQVSEMVTGDPALAAQVLRIVNSPLYGLSQKVGSVFRAVVYLGHLEVRNVIWNACVNEGLGNLDRQAGALVDELWRHSFATSKLAYALARSLGMAEPDQLATTALLHDVGKLISLNVWPDTASTLYYPVQFSDWSVIAEEARLGAYHARLGAEVARVWGLPEESVAAIGQHHAPSYFPFSKVAGNRKATALVHCADLLVHASTSVPEGEEEPPIYLPHESWLKLLGVESIDRLCTPEVVAALPRRQLRSLPAFAPEVEPLAVD